MYYYVKNAMGDVIGIVNREGERVCTYEYDAWGNVLNTYHHNSKGMDYYVGERNPIRYRSYYFDNSIGFYYLQSRFYFSSMARFINADLPIYAQKQKDMNNGTNLFAYCNNDPVNYVDPSGTFIILIISYIIVNNCIKNAISSYAKYIKLKTDNSHGCKNKYAISIDLTQGKSKKKNQKKNAFTDDLYQLYIQYKNTMFSSELFDFLAELCESKFKKKYKRDIIFTNSCMSNEIEKHVLGYLYSLGYKNVSKPLIFTAYSKQSLCNHCKTIEISEADVYDWKQSNGFGYFGGIRDQYKCTQNDPFYYSSLSELKKQHGANQYYNSDKRFNFARSGWKKRKLS